MSEIDVTDPWDSRLLGASLDHAELYSDTLPQQVKCYDVMVDLETMGLPPYGPIVAIGAVCFDLETGKLAESFYRVISLASEVNAGAVITPSTVMWWLTQSNEAREALTRKGAAVPVADALDAFTAFLNRAIPNIKDRHVWGNGAAFDNVMLRAAYARQGMKEPWYFSNDQDVRTIVRLGKAIGFDPKKDMAFEGERHHALADAIHQAKYVSAIYQKLGLSRARGQTPTSIIVDCPAFIEQQ